jgi:hypothetical protein
LVAIFLFYVSETADVWRTPMATCDFCSNTVDDKNNQSETYILNYLMLNVYEDVYVCSRECKESYIDNSDYLHYCHYCENLFNTEQDYGYDEFIDAMFCCQEHLEEYASNQGYKSCYYCSKYFDPEGNDDIVVITHNMIIYYFCNESCSASVDYWVNN